MKERLNNLLNSIRSFYARHSQSWKNKVSALSIVFFTIIITFSTILYLQGPRPLKLTKTPKDSSFMYIAADPKNGFAAEISEKETNAPKVKANFTGDKYAEFVMTKLPDKIKKPTKLGNKISYKDIKPDMDLTYETLENGIKEEIILNAPVTSNQFDFTLTASGAYPKRVTEQGFSTEFFDSNGQYLFHFAKPFAIDAADNRTDTAYYLVQDGAEPGTYDISLFVNNDWLQDPERVYPIIVDPTIIYDTSTEFATGIFNRSFDTGSGASPNLTTYYQELPADQSTVGLWHLNEASGNTIDSSGNGFTGTSTGTTVTAGIFGNARTFNGTSNYITASFNSSTVLDRDSNPVTMEAWFKTNSVSVAQGIISRGTVGADGYGIRVNTTGKINLGSHGGGNFDGLTTLETGKWYHVVGVINGSDSRIYLNGVLDQVGTVNVNASTINNLYIGAAWTGAVSTFFSGSIDEVRISSVARSAEEIRLSAQRRPYSTYTSQVLDFNSVTSGWNPFSWTELGVRTGDGETLKDATGLIAQWNFNGTSGTTATNDAGTCGATCNGTLTNFASTASQDAAPLTGWTAANKRWGAGALMFDGTNDFVSVPTTGSIDFNYNQDFGVTTWVKIPSSQVNTTNTSNEFIFKFDGVNSRYPYVFRINNQTHALPGKLNVLRFDGTNAPAIASSNPINDNQWHHLAFTKSGSTLSLFIDGKLNGTTTDTTTTTTTNSSALYFGSRAGTSFYFTGILDSTAIYSRALTSAEILSNYNVGNIEFQTRTGADTTPNDGSWTPWSPITSETQILSLDSDSSNWKIDQSPTNPESCKDILDQGLSTGDGTYTIQLGGQAVSVYCDMTTNGGGWTLVANIAPNDGGSVGYNNQAFWTGSAEYGSFANKFANDYKSPAAYLLPSTELMIESVNTGASGSILGWRVWPLASRTFSSLFSTNIATVHSASCATGVSSAANVGTTNVADDIIRQGSCLYSDLNTSASGIADIMRLSTISYNGLDNKMAGFASCIDCGAIWQGTANPYMGIDRAACSTSSCNNATICKMTSADCAGSYCTATYAGTGGTCSSSWNSRFFVREKTTVFSKSNSTTIKSEGSGSLKIQTGVSSVDPSTVGLWHLDETGGTGAYLKSSRSLPFATGGTVSYSGSYTLHTFNESGTFTVNGTGNIETLVVGGGGGGGETIGGGGGGGGVISNSSFAVTPQAYAITVGGGGAGGTDAVAGTYPAGTKGGNSVFSTLTAIGGGGGAGYSGAASGTGGSAGGNGAGGGARAGYTAGQGNDGSNQGDSNNAGAGGGAGAVGGTASTNNGGDGGVGISSSITGTALLYGGGGGGGGRNATTRTPGLGGAGGGGAGSEDGATGIAGAANNGGGGGGGGYRDTGAIEGAGGAGGSGIVIIRYPTSNSPVTVSSDGTPTGTTVVNGITGKGRSFNGTNDYINAGNGTSLSFGSGNFSVEAWIKTNTTSRRTILSKFQTPGPPERGMVFDVLATGQVRLLASTDTGNYIYADSSLLVNDNKWHHVAGVRSGSKTKVYVDGVVSGSQTTTGTVSTVDNAINLTIGFPSFSGSTYWIGSIDEIKISNVDRTAEEIAETYLMGRDHYINKAISSTDLSGKTSLPFYVAGDRPGSYINAIIGETDYANYQPDANTVGLWHLDDTQPGFPTTSYACIGATIQSYTVPAGVSKVNAKVWGAGGGGGYSGGWAYGFAGGGGGYAGGDINVTPGQVLNIVAGCPGINGSSSLGVARAWPNGGQACNSGSDCRYGGGGGGFSGIYNPSTSTYHLMAGAGGGGGSSRAANGQQGGAGGGDIGINGSSYTAASGGGGGNTWTGGGAGGTGSYAGAAGSGQVGGNNGINSYGGGGGSGWYGGGGGGYLESNDMGGGGGGSSYFAGSAALGVTNASTLAGSGVTPGNSTDPDNGGYGTGGGVNVAGTSGRIVISVPNQTQDTSGKSNNGFLSGTTSTTGKIGQGRSFNGTSDFISIPDSTSLSPESGNMTISAWVRPSLVDSTYKRIYTDYGSVANNLVMIWQNSSNKFQAYYRDGAGNSVTPQSTTTPVANTWYHVVGVRNGTTGYLYINGVLEASATNGSLGTISTATGIPPRISGYWANEFFAGLIDEVRIDKVARSADEIRQAFEVGARTHQITIDFGANLTSGNRITSSTDTLFTINSTAYGLGTANLAENIYVGDKIIVRENYDGTEYIAQGTVDQVINNSGFINVSAWDAGSTFPPGGFTENGDAFKWQREYFDLSSILSTHKDAITRLSLRINGGNEGHSVWLDDFESAGSYLSTSAGSTITSATGDQYFQFRLINSSSDYAVAPSLTSATTDFQTLAPNPPTIGTPVAGPTSITWAFTDNTTTPSETETRVYDTSNVLTFTCIGTNLTECIETGLIPNTQYTRKLTANNANGNSLYSASATKYTLAATPGIPTVSNRVATTVGINPDPQNNSAPTLFAIYKEEGFTCDGTGGSYITGTGSDNGATPIWLTDTAWGTVTASGLNSEKAYSFCVKAKNADNVETSWSPTASFNAGFVPIAGEFIYNGNTIYSQDFANRYPDGYNVGRFVVAVDDGALTNTANFRMQSGILVINSTDTLAVGQLSMEGGSIALSEAGGQIKIGANVYIKDEDADGWSSDGKLYVGDAPVGGRRKAIAVTLATNDCNDANAAQTTGTLNTYYQDADGDGYGRSSVTTQDCSLPAGYSVNSTDCNDNPISGGNEVRISHAQCYADADGDTFTGGLAANSTCLNTTSCATATRASASTHTSAVSNYTAGRLLNSASAATDCNDSSYNGINNCYTVATGGTITTSGNYKVHTFTASGTFTVTNLGTSPSVEYLIVGGGGGGGGGVTNIAYPAGGGGGKVNTGTGNVAAQAYSITVGGGGSYQEGSGVNGGSGATSNALTLNAGGGQGGVAQGTGGQSGSGRPGGIKNSLSSGGGAGEATDGGNAPAGEIGGNGGNGIASSISGVSTYYGGGGAGWGVNGYGSHGLGGGVGSYGGGGGTQGQAGGGGIVILRYQYQ